VKLDVWGSCLARDVLGIVESDGLEVGKYFQLSPFTQMDTSEIMMRDRVELDEVDRRKHEYRERMAKAELNREVLESLEQSDSEWIVIDLRYYSYHYYRVKFGGSQHLYLSLRVNKNEVQHSIEKKGLEMESLEYCTI